MILNHLTYSIKTLQLCVAVASLLTFVLLLVYILLLHVLLHFTFLHPPHYIVVFLFKQSIIFLKFF